MVYLISCLPRRSFAKTGPDQVKNKIFASLAPFFTAQPVQCSSRDCAQDLSGGMTLKAPLVKRIPLDAKYPKKDLLPNRLRTEYQGSKDRGRQTPSADYADSRSLIICNQCNQHNLWIIGARERRTEARSQ
jgi:hypothetical protein